MFILKFPDLSWRSHVHLEEQYLAFKNWLLTMFYLLFLLQYFYWNRSSYLEGKASGLHYMLDQTRSSHFSFSLAIYVSPPRQLTLAGIANFCPYVFSVSRSFSRFLNLTHFLANSLTIFFFWRIFYHSFLTSFFDDFLMTFLTIVLSNPFDNFFDEF